MNTYQKARTFIYRNARPLDLARWQYHFEGGSKKAVLAALSAYQNEDGGFGHALEPDLWNQQSTPFSTSVAIAILKKIDFYNCEHPVIQGIIGFLESGAGFTEKGWLQKMPSNNDYPHAPWWNYSNERSGGFHADFEYNPTAELAGFCLRVLPNDVKLWKTSCRIVGEALERLSNVATIERHELGCYCSLFTDLTVGKQNDIFPLSKLASILKASVNKEIESNPDKWNTYVAKPSDFMNGNDSIFYADNKDIADYECEYIIKSQLGDGSWPIPWGWAAYPEEWAISKNWWKGNGAILNMLLGNCEMKSDENQKHE
ncbi:MAG: hypothetical protein PHV32_11275 [Eubacteriales bacterium]|nr:hypothetical protein [Eubacteriales bacterium]